MVASLFSFCRTPLVDVDVNTSLSRSSVLSARLVTLLWLIVTAVGLILPKAQQLKLMPASSDVDFIRWFERRAVYQWHRNRIVIQFDGELVSSTDFTGFIHDLVLTR